MWRRQIRECSAQTTSFMARKFLSEYQNDLSETEYEFYAGHKWLEFYAFQPRPSRLHSTVILRGNVQIPSPVIFAFKAGLQVR